MGKEKIHKTSKKTYVRLGIIIFVVLLLGWLYYQSQRPNYRDLEKAYSQLQIPADWQQIGQSDNKGTWGLFCWQIGGESCPFLSRDFTRSSQISIPEIRSTLSSIEMSLRTDGYKIETDGYSKCTDSDLKTSVYVCSVTATKSGTTAYYSIRGTSPQGISGNYAYISVSPEDN